jgi:hypothetical protein
VLPALISQCGQQQHCAVIDSSVKMKKYRMIDSRQWLDRPVVAAEVATVERNSTKEATSP